MMAASGRLISMLLLLFVIISILFVGPYLVLFPHVLGTIDTTVAVDKLSIYRSTIDPLQFDDKYSSHASRRMYMPLEQSTADSTDSSRWSSFNASSSSSSIVGNSTRRSSRSLSTIETADEMSSSLGPSTSITSSSLLLPSTRSRSSISSSSRPISLIKCSNQTKCIQPVLQLKKIYKVYYCNHVG